MAAFGRWLLVGLVMPGVAFAHGGVDAAKRSAEASMLVTGEIAVNPDGSVYGYSLDHRDKLPAVVVKLIGQTLPGWKFTPVEVQGKPVRAKALMSLRVVAKQMDAKHDAVSVKSAEFGVETPQSLQAPACANGACLTFLDRQPPAYPFNLVSNLVSGTVYLAVKVDRQGKVAQVAVEQVDLRRIADETILGRWRQELGRVSMEAARHWTFQVPRTGPEADRKYWVATVPINYNIPVPGQAKTIGSIGYGQWDFYVPGPVNSIPWVHAQRGQDVAKSGADAVPDNGMPFVPDSRFVLLTSLGGDGAANAAQKASPGQG